MYLITVLCWPEDGYKLAETHRHLINCKACGFINYVVFVDGIIYQYMVITRLQLLNVMVGVRLCVQTICDFI
jgi:hypothetical protein